MQLFSIESLKIVALAVSVVWLMRFVNRLFSSGIASIDRRVISEETERLRKEYDERVDTVRKTCDEKIATLRFDYERRIHDLESQIEVLFKFLRESNMAPEMEAMEKQQAKEKKDGRRKQYVLGIWPQSNLGVSSERDAVYNSGFEYMSLAGEQVKRSSILQKLRGGKVTILEIGAHGDTNGIFINGENLSAGWWENVLRDRNIEVAVILACFSDSSVADAIRRAGVPSVIAVNGEIDDTAAIEFAQEFYRLYADGAEVETAYKEARWALDYKQAEKLILRQGRTGNE